MNQEAGSTAPSPTVDCKIHGVNAWNGEIQCADCGAAYTTKEPASSMHAPPRCRMCGCRLMPVDNRGHFRAKRGQYFSATQCCSVCFAEAPGMAFQQEHEVGSPFCKGEECAFHGPQIKKLRKRAAQAQRASSQPTFGPAT